MSDDYREITQGEVVSEEGSSSEHIADLEMDDFVWEDVLEEIGRFERFDVDMPFTKSDWLTLSKYLRNYITAKHLLSKVSNNLGSDSKLPNLDLNAKSIVDV